MIKKFRPVGLLLVVAMVVMVVVPSATAAPKAQNMHLQFWSTETQPERAAKTKAIIDRFTEQTGIDVTLVLTDENTLDSLMAANLAAGTLPDVIFHPVDFTAAWNAEGILDADAATTVINDLGDRKSVV